MALGGREDMPQVVGVLAASRTESCLGTGPERSDWPDPMMVGSPTLSPVYGPGCRGALFGMFGLVAAQWLCARDLAL